MEIYTLVKAGIRSKKGISIGFMLLTMLIVISMISMIGVQKNFKSSLQNAYETQDNGVISAFFYDGVFTEEYQKEVEDSELVSFLEVRDGITGTNIHHGDNKEGNGYIVTKMIDTVSVFNESATEISKYKEKDYASELKKGEIYLPYGTKDRLKLNVGDKVSFDFLGASRDFTVKGFVQECYMGSSVIGYKTVFISDEEFDELLKICKDNIKSEDDVWGVGKLVFVHPSSEANESSDLFLRDLNRENKFGDLSFMMITRETSEHYTGIFINVILAFLTGFSVLLFAIFLIVVGHNISTEMEMDYVDLGILKSQGFTDNVIRKVYIIQYLLIEVVGIILGVIIAVPCERILSKVFFNLTCVLPDKSIPIVESLLLTALLFVITFIFVYIYTRRVSRTTPVKAITGYKSDYYFESKLNAPISQKLMGLSLSFRQLTSAPKRYISIFVVSTLLIFTIITVELSSGYIMSKHALISMGEPFTEIDYRFTEAESEVTVDDIENEIKKYSDIEGREYESHVYVSINGENVMNSIKAYPEEFSSVYKGRDVKYDNEIVVTEQICKMMNVDIGDTVTVGRDGLSQDYVVVGIFQTMSDTGKAISMSLDGLSRLKKDPEEKYTVNQLNMFGVALKDPDQAEMIADKLNEKYGDYIEVESSNFEDTLGQLGNSFYLAATGSEVMIYVLTFIFALVTVSMVSSKIFIQERTDIGIYRAVGFTVKRVRLQFALRFAFISLISAVFGVILARLYSGELLESLFSMFGIPHIELEYGIMFFVKPILVFTLLYFVFGYISSRKVKKVSSRELITE